MNIPYQTALQGSDMQAAYALGARRERCSGCRENDRPLVSANGARSHFQAPASARRRGVALPSCIDPPTRSCACRPSASASRICNLHGPREDRPGFTIGHDSGTVTAFGDACATWTAAIVSRLLSRRLRALLLRPPLLFTIAPNPHVRVTAWPRSVSLQGTHPISAVPTPSSCCARCLRGLSDDVLCSPPATLWNRLSRRRRKRLQPTMSRPCSPVPSACAPSASFAVGARTSWAIDTGSRTPGRPLPSARRPCN